MSEQVRFDRMLHGGDYNPEQWRARPDILFADIDLLKQAGCNTVTVGMFSWSALEPEEGVFDFAWLQQILDDMDENGIQVILGTPSGARPKWLADKYPEVLRVDENRHRNLFGARHNHCYTSPVYREKVGIINRQLARRFGGHPAVILWHLSNEYGGECHCDLCQHQFRIWLQTQYRDIDELNREWWTAFWSHTYRGFDEIESPSPRGEEGLHGLNLAWKRFVTARTVDFMRHEADCIREVAPGKPVTTNFMYYFDPLNYHKFAEAVDIVTWDSYPPWGKYPLHETALDTALWHDVMRSLKHRPFLLMESCPSATNWQPVSKLKRPGVLELQSLQAVAHGSDSVLYFQIRQSRGSSEKFHGAVIDQYGKADTRVFAEVSATGKALAALAPVCGAGTRAKVALVYDWESKWAMEDAKGPRNENLFYKRQLLKHYAALRRLGLDVDVVDMEQDLAGYALVAAPMLYLFRAGFEEKARRLVEGGGALVMGYWSGIVGPNDLCHLGPVPHGLTDVLGLRHTEIDALYDGEQNSLVPAGAGLAGMAGRYACDTLCDVVEATTATALMAYGEDFYAGTPAFTKNAYGKGTAWYMAADAEPAFYQDAYAAIAKAAGLAAPVPEGLPEGLLLNRRRGEHADYLFLQNFTDAPLPLPAAAQGLKAVYGATEGGQVAAMSTLVLEKAAE